MRRTALAISLTAVCAAGSTVVAGANKQQITFSDSGQQPQLSRILVEIENNHLDSALEQTEAILRQYPNFRLAHLIKGDLLLDRSTPLLTFGNASNAPQDYQSNNLNNPMKKRQYWIREEGTWKIIFEGAT